MNPAQDMWSGLFAEGKLSQQQADLAIHYAEQQQAGLANARNTYSSGYSQAPPSYAQCSTVSAVPSCTGFAAVPDAKLSPSKPKELSLFTEIGRDIKSFVLEHRSTLYFLALALILDHVLFKDAFRHRLQSIVDKIITKVEDKVAG